MSAISTRNNVNTGIIVPKSISSDFVWEIKDFSMICKNGGSYIDSPEFSTLVEGISKLSGIAKWRLKLYYNGYKDGDRDDLALFIQYLNNDTVFADVELSFLNSASRKVVTKSIKIKVDTKGFMWGLKKFATKQYIENPKNQVLMNDTLKVQCDIIISDRVHGLIKRMDTSFSNMVKAGEKMRPLICRLQEFDDYEKLLENGNFSDIAIVIGEEQIPAHKAIIASRSTVFEAMFKHDMKEKEENIIKITDIKSEVMKEVLRFMYAGKVNKIEEITSDLLMAAEKYSITGLKELCIQAMLKNVKIENALEFLKLADMCNTPSLKTHVLEFIASNQKAIVDKPEFVLFKDLHSELQFELVQAIIANNSNQ